MVTHADLSRITDGWNEIVVDGRGNVYVNGGTDFHPEEGVAPGVIALVTPDGSVRQVADNIAFPNGMVVTPDDSTLIIAESFAGILTAFDIAADGSLSNRRVWADHTGDGICMDAEGAIWCQTMNTGGTTVERVAEGGEVLDRIEVDLPCFACTLGGDDGRTLFMLVADWRLGKGSRTTSTGSPPDHAPARSSPPRHPRRRPAGHRPERPHGRRAHPVGRAFGKGGRSR